MNKVASFAIPLREGGRKSGWQGDCHHISGTLVGPSCPLEWNSRALRQDLGVKVILFLTLVTLTEIVSPSSARF